MTLQKWKTDQIGWEEYADEYSVKEKDIVQMVIEENLISFYLNELSLGVMYDDEEIGMSVLHPFIQFNSKNDEVAILSGEC